MENVSFNKCSKCGRSLILTSDKAHICTICSMLNLWKYFAMGIILIKEDIRETFKFTNKEYFKYSRS
jgi:hypothetical protein